MMLVRRQLVRHGLMASSEQRHANRVQSDCELRLDYVLLDYHQVTRARFFQLVRWDSKHISVHLIPQ